MAVDIGPKIGIDGEAEFRKQINELSQIVRTYGTEMKAVSSAFDDNVKSQEALTRQNQILSKSIDAQERKVEELKKGLQAATREFGDNDQRTLKWAQSVNNATADLNKMKNQIKQNDRALNALEDGIDDVGDSLDDAGKSAVGFGDLLGANLAADVITSAISGIASGLKQISEESREYRKIMGSLEISSEQAGYSAEETKQAYQELYGVLADNQTAATTTANLQALNLEQKELNQLIDGTIGAWARYGDSIPIDGLAEAINETVKAGTVTGTFADVLNWAGTNEDAFNEKLAAAGSESARVNLILQELSNQGLMEAGQAWQENNKSLVEANQATADFEEITAAMGERIEPVLTAIQGAVNGVLSVFLALTEDVDFEIIANGIRSVGEMFAQLVNQISGGNLTIEESFSEISDKLSETLDTMISYIDETLPDYLESGSDIVSSLISGISSEISNLIDVGIGLTKDLNSTFLDSLPEMLEAGGEILISLAEGIVKTVPKLLEASASSAGSFISGILENLPEILETGIKLLGELIAGIIRAIPDLIAAIPQITSAFYDEIIAYDWGELGKDILKGLANGILGAVGSVVDAAKDAAGRISSAFKDFFDIHSPSVLMKDEVGRQIVEGIAEGIRASGKFAKKSAEEVSEAILKAAEQTLNNHKVYNDMTLSEEAAFWEKMRKETQEGTQARIDADKKYFAVKKNLDNQMIAAEKRYKDNVSRVYEDLQKNIKSAWDGYRNEIESVTNSIKSQMGLFDKFEKETELTSSDLLDNLQSQVDGLEDWLYSLDNLKNRGVSDAFLEELRGLGVSAAAELELLTEMTDDELEQYVRLWEDKNALAKEAAEDQLKPLLKSTMEQIAELQSDAAKELKAYQDEYVTALKEIGVELVEPLEKIRLDLVEGFSGAVQSIAAAIGTAAESKESKEQYEKISNTLLDSVKDLPEIFRESGANIVAGLIAGLESKSPELFETVSRIANQTLSALNGSKAMIKSLQGPGAANDFTHNIPTYANGTAAAYDRLASKLSGMQIVLDDGTLVGKLSPQIDLTLGGYAKIEGRYGT